MFSRRHFLKASSAVGLSALSMGHMRSLAADQSGYKALVCVFFFGGQDHEDTVIPYDQASYDSWRAARQVLIDQFNEEDAPFRFSRDRSNLIPLSPLNAGQFGSRQWAMPEQLRPLTELFDAERLAIVGNVGPLIVPTDRQAYEDETVPLPDRLNSHNDQQSTWQTGGTEGATFGWGGRILDQYNGSLSNAAFSVSSSPSPFVTGTLTTPVTLKSSGLIVPFGLNGDSYFSGEPEMIVEHFRQSGANSSNLFTRDMSSMLRQSINTTDELSSILDAATAGETVRIDGNSLSESLGLVADIIQQNSMLGASRQVFFVSTGGFDTHSDLSSTLPFLQSTYANAIKSFDDTMVSIGLGNAVTTFTASDFGRRLIPNSSGTDHGWGGHHFVVGGAVRGKRIFGDLPEPIEGHDQDRGKGILIPNISVEQYASPMGKWFGLNDSELATVFPNYGNFDHNMALF